MAVKAVLKKTFLGILVALVVIFTILWIVFSGEVNTAFKESEAYKASVNYIKLDKDLEEQIGNIEGFGRNIGGYLTPKTKARFVFKVIGSSSSVKATCKLEFYDQAWHVLSVEYK